MSQRLVLLLLLAPGLAALLGCNSGLDDAADTEPSVFSAGDASTCGGAGTTTITLDVLSARVVSGDPVSNANGQNRLEFSGTISGYVAGQGAWAVLVDDRNDCPVLAATPIAITGDGAFTAVARAESRGVPIDHYRVVVVTGPAGANPGCAAGSDCIELDSAGTFVAVTGASNAIGVLL